MGKSAKRPKPVVKAPKTMPVRGRVLYERFEALRAQHPDQYIAYREAWDGDVLKEPFLVAAGADMAEVRRVLDALGPKDREGVYVRFLRKDRVIFVATTFPRVRNPG